MRRTNLPKIAIRNRQKTLRIDPAAVRRLVRAVWLLADLGSQISNRDISLAFVVDEEIARINEQYLGHHGPTDVITFQHGEIVISTERARAQARQFRTEVHDELALYLIHGLLHLAGYDDTSAPRRRVMIREQTGLLRKVRNELDLRTLFR